MVRHAKPEEDAQAIADIYNYYILNTVVTFEEEPVSAGEMTRRINEITKKHPWLVYEEDGKVVGYAYGMPWRARIAYRFSAECSVYLHHEYSGKGIGTKLYEVLFAELKKLNVHGVIGGVALPNDASIFLHEKFGFEKVAHFKEVGFKFNTWVDVAYWEKIF